MNDSELLVSAVEVIRKCGYALAMSIEKDKVGWLQQVAAKEASEFIKQLSGAEPRRSLGKGNK